MAKGFDCFPLWLNDWRGSTARLEFPPLARLAYLELMFLQWSMASSTRSSLPRSLVSSDEKLSLGIGLTIDEWRSVKALVLSRFEVDERGDYSNLKVAREIAKRNGNVRGGKRRQVKGQVKGQPSSSSSSILEER